ncbi:MAG: hypothetical protein V2I36_09970 [Desulfopila sp.]|jgi:hypothetical protein|nr:hypothetical protein [Desulfopila sp.]
MAFETFTGRQSITNEPKISILKQGLFNFNNGAAKILQEKKITHLQILYDKDANKIGFKPCSEKKPGAYKVRAGKGGGAQISGMAFLNHFKIPYKSSTRSYPASWDESQKLLIIEV